MESNSFDKLYQKIEALLIKVESIESKLNATPLGKSPKLQMDFPVSELVNFKEELEEIKHKLARPGQQVIDITVYNMLKTLENTANEIRESTGFVKNIFTQEKLKRERKKTPRQEAVNVYLRKYVKSMK